jgi:hypothetical protein
MSRRRAAIVGLCASALVASTGCAGTRPWEREEHALRAMRRAPDPGGAALDEHVYDSREGASGGFEDAEGAGCGCN